MSPPHRGPLLIEPARTRHNLIEFFFDDPGYVQAKLLTHGALLFRGFGLDRLAQFEAVVDALPFEKLAYTYRSTPRTAVGRNVFTATEYPPNEEIALHNENAYQRDWPLKIGFFCLCPAANGGETPVADSTKVTVRIGNELTDRFEQLGVEYIRHYRPYVDLSWETVFQTSDRTEVANFCRSHGLVHDWLDDSTLRTSQVCQGVAYHPQSAQRVFFNQAHLFHRSALPATVVDDLVLLFGSDRLPRHARYGNGEEIPVEHLNSIRAAFRNEAIDVRWQSGDFLLLDNMQFAHGRKSYSGARKVLVALMDSAGRLKQSKALADPVEV